MPRWLIRGGQDHVRFWTAPNDAERVPSSALEGAALRSSVASNRDAIGLLVDRCQSGILALESRPTDLVRTLEESIHETTQTLRALSPTDRLLARTTIGRILRRALYLQGLSADAEISSALATFVVEDSTPDELSGLFRRWITVLSLGAGQPSLLDARLRRAFTFIRRGYRSRELSLQRTANVAGVSSWHLTRLLRKATGATFTAHVRLARVEAAGRLLLSTSLSIKEIASRLGYADSSELDHDFHRVRDVSPTAYRRARSDTK